MVSNYLLSLNIVKDAKTCRTKWHHLAKSYRIIKDNKRRTGRGRIKFAFFNEMDEILGLRRSNGGADTIGSGINGVVLVVC